MNNRSGRFRLFYHILGITFPGLEKWFDVNCLYVDAAYRIDCAAAIASLVPVATTEELEFLRCAPAPILSELAEREYQRQRILSEILSGVVVRAEHRQIISEFAEKWEKAFGSALWGTSVCKLEAPVVADLRSFSVQFSNSWEGEGGAVGAIGLVGCAGHEGEVGPAGIPEPEVEADADAPVFVTRQKVVGVDYAAGESRTVVSNPKR